MDWPAGKYGAIVADPPWRFKSWTALEPGNWHSRRDAEKHYPVMSLEEIKALPVRTVAGRDSHLFLWVTGPKLPQAFDVITAWGYRYSAVAFVWIKLKRRHDPRQLRVIPLTESDLHVGPGHTTRKNAEFCLLARRGNARRIAKDVREVILAPVREHSRKPDEAYERVERYCAGPYLDLFAREKRPGWTAWGNEVDHFSRIVS